MGAFGIGSAIAGGAILGGLSSRGGSSKSSVSGDPALRNLAMNDAAGVRRTLTGSPLQYSNLFAPEDPLQTGAFEGIEGLTGQSALRDAGTERLLALLGGDYSSVLGGLAPLQQAITQQAMPGLLGSFRSGHSAALPAAAREISAATTREGFAPLLQAQLNLGLNAPGIGDQEFALELERLRAGLGFGTQRRGIAGEELLAEGKEKNFAAELARSDAMQNFQNSLAMFSASPQRTQTTDYPGNVFGGALTGGFLGGGLFNAFSPGSQVAGGYNPAQIATAGTMGNFANPFIANNPYAGFGSPVRYT